MATLNTTGTISFRTNGYAVGRLLKRAQPNLVTERFGQIDPQGEKKTKTRKFRRHEAISPAIAPVAEGIVPSGAQLNVTDLECSLEQYVQVIWITDQVQDFCEDNVLQDSVDNLSVAFSETIELIRFAVLKAGTNVFYANNVTSRATVNSPPVLGDIRRVVRSLRKNRAQTISKVVDASVKYGTTPVEEAYFAIIPTELESDVRNITGFSPASEYGNVLPHELGKVENVRFMLSNVLTGWSAAGASGTVYLSGGVAVSTAASCDVYPILVFGQNAYGIVPFKGKNAVKIMVQNPDTPSVADPAGQKGFVSGKMYQTAIITQDLWMARVECAATANPT